MVGMADELVFAVGIEDTFIPQRSAGRRALDEYELTGHYDRWRTDLAMAQQTGATAIRYGLPWYRVNPEAGRFDWSWSDQVIDEMLRLGLDPIIDLMHYGCPQWLDGEFANPDYPTAVAEYAHAAASRYGDRVSQWTPMNEPLLNAIFCGLEGRWPPNHVGDDRFVRLVSQLATGIVRTQEVLHEVVPELRAVHVEASFRWEGHGGTPGHVEFLRERNWLVYDLLFGRVGEQHPLWRYLTSHGFEEADASFFREHVTEPDVMGVNYYPHLTTRSLSPDGTSRYVWSGTWGLDELLRGFHARYGKPLFLTETSVGGSVGLRTRWLHDSVDLVMELRSEGLPVLGYTWWPLFSLVDWDVRESGLPVDDHLVHMGLWDLRPDGDGDLERTPTSLVDEFRGLASQRGVRS